MSIVTKLDKMIVKKSHKFRIYIEIKNVDAVNDVIAMVTQDFDGRNIQITGPRSDVFSHCGMEATISAQNEEDGTMILQKLIDNEHIVYALSAI